MQRIPHTAFSMGALVKENPHNRSIKAHYFLKRRKGTSGNRYLEVEVGSKGDEDADDRDHEGCGDPGNGVRLKRVELHPTQYSYLHWKQNTSILGSCTYICRSAITLPYGYLPTLSQASNVLVLWRWTRLMWILNARSMWRMLVQFFVIESTLTENFLKLNYGGTVGS